MGCGSSNAQTALETSNMPHKNGNVGGKSDKADDNASNMEQTSVPAIDIRKCVKRRFFVRL